MKILTKKQMLKSEQRSAELGVSLKQLMDNAGFALFEQIKNYAYQNMITDCLVIVGSGNNGGDGLVAANLLNSSGISTTILLTGEVCSTLAKEAFNALDKNIHVLHMNGCNYIKTVSEAEIIVDCVFGTGFHGEFSEEILSLFSAVSSSSAYKIACDLPRLFKRFCSKRNCQIS